MICSRRKPLEVDRNSFDSGEASHGRETDEHNSELDDRYKRRYKPPQRGDEKRNEING